MANWIYPSIGAAIGVAVYYLLPIIRHEVVKYHKKGSPSIAQAICSKCGETVYEFTHMRKGGIACSKCVRPGD